MDSFWLVTLFNMQPAPGLVEKIEYSATNDFGALGIEEYSMGETEVDELLGERSYSGGDLPEQVLDEVEQHMSLQSKHLRFFFADEISAIGFKNSITNECLCEIQVENCPQEDWNAEWKKHYSPIKINDLLEVVPSWRSDYVSDSKRIIYINPGMGFGTGSHETTFLCLKIFTEELLGKTISSCLDFGSGSGILGLSIFKFLPEALVDFYDIDPEANENCLHNAEINKLSNHSFRLLLPEYRDRLKPSYQLVFANILENILLLEQEYLVNHTAIEGHLILSGLLKHQVPGIVGAYEASGLRLIRHDEKGDWAALLFQRLS